jgi:hypothetical protein
MTELFKNDQPPAAKDVQATIGLALVDQRGDYIGKVKDIRDGSYIVDRSLSHQPDLCVPFSACAVAAHQLELTISKFEIDQHSW